MAIASEVFYSDGYFELHLYPEEPRERVGADPPVPSYDRDSPIWLSWDGKKLESGEYEFVGLTIVDLRQLTAQDIQRLQQIPLPRVDLPEASLFHAEVADVLRWAQRTYLGSEAAAARATSAPHCE
jgi:hypothetical protein